MAGHSKWAQIKHKKGISDQKRGALFSKILAAIAVAARTDENPERNPRLRALVEKAKAHNVPHDTIRRAMHHASQTNAVPEKLLCEAYGPGGIKIIIEAATDNKNRTLSEIKKILAGAGTKWAEPGSVRWAFDHTLHHARVWQAKFPQKIGDNEHRSLKMLVDDLREHQDIQQVYTNEI